MNKIIGTNSRSRSFVSLAKVTLAGMRRAHEMRMHPRAAFYTFGFMDNLLEDLSLKEKHTIIHRGAGDT